MVHDHRSQLVRCRGCRSSACGRFSIRYAWPSAYWGSLPLEGGIEAAYRADIDAAEDPKAKLAEIEDRLNKLRSPFRSAEKFWVEEIIDPRKTRSLLCEFARLAEPLRTPAWPRWRCGPDYLASAIIIAAPFPQSLRLACWCCPT